MDRLKKRRSYIQMERRDLKEMRIRRRERRKKIRGCEIREAFAGWDEKSRCVYGYSWAVCQFYCSYSCAAAQCLLNRWWFHLFFLCNINPCCCCCCWFIWIINPFLDLEYFWRVSTVKSINMKNKSSISKIRCLFFFFFFYTSTLFVCANLHMKTNNYF